MFAKKFIILSIIFLLISLVRVYSYNFNLRHSLINTKKIYTIHRFHKIFDKFDHELNSQITYNDPSIRIDSKTFQKQTSLWRILTSITFLFGYLNHTKLDAFMNNLYTNYILNMKIFHHYSFEPLLASFCFASYIGIYAIFDYFIPSLHKYRIQNNDSLIAWKDRLKDSLFNEVPWYLGVWVPFGGFMKARKVSYVSPNLLVIFKEVFLGLILYDLFFFIGHNLLHRVPFLYRFIHSKHHKLQTIRAGDSIRHTFLDGTWDVICAVLALNILKAHAVSRSLFNIVAIGLITEAHSGYNFPWQISNVIPLNIFAGSLAHDIHHQKGNVNYQKFFTYLDSIAKYINIKL